MLWSSLLKSACTRPNSSPLFKSLCVNACSLRTAAMPPAFKPVQDKGDTDEGGPSLRVISYNILAQCYVKSSNFPHSPKNSLSKKPRTRKILDELVSFDADLLCLQELDEFEAFYRPKLEDFGYASLYKQRPGKKKDGCGIFYKTSKLDLIKRKDIEYNDLVPPLEMVKILGQGDEPEARDISNPWVRLKRDCVGIMGAFAWKDSTEVAFIAACTHLYWDPELADVKLAQARHLLSSLAGFQRQLSATSPARTIPVIVGGDFNSQPGDKVYRFLSGEETGGASQGTENKEDSLPSSSGNISDNVGRTLTLLHSAYACQGAEPPFTSYTPGFTGTLDYIWFWPPSTVHVDALLDIPGPKAASIQNGLPNDSHGSDHLPLGADIRIVA